MRYLKHLFVIGSVCLMAVLFFKNREIEMIISQTGPPQATIPVGEIVGEKTAGEVFLSKFEGFSRIDILMATYARKNNKKIFFHLKEIKIPNNMARFTKEFLNQKTNVESLIRSEKGKTLVTQTLNASDLKDNSFHTFRFPSVKNGVGNLYYFYLESPDSVPGNAITIWSSSLSIYKNGAKIESGCLVEGDLIFRIYNEMNLEQAFGTFLSRMPEDKPKYFSSNFYRLIFGLYFVATIGFVIHLIKIIDIHGAFKE